MYFLLFMLWFIALIFNCWLLPELLIYGIAKFAATYFGGDMPTLSVGGVLSACAVNAVTITISLYMIQS